MSPPTEEVLPLPVASIDPSPYQPRVRFTEEALEELAASIWTHGFIQPVVVRPWGVRYQLVAGERRLRAARRLGLEEIPAVIRLYTDEQALEAALVENLQREDISVVETARAYQRLTEEFQYTHNRIARQTGKSRTTITNTVRLLQLPTGVLDLLDAGELTEGHARALLALPYARLQEELGEWVARNAVTVRETERKVRHLLAQAVGEPAGRREAGSAPVTRADANLAALEARLRERFGTRVEIAYRAAQGSISLEFYDDEDLCRLLELLGLE
jgi:ParB family transcriptional regulator, chromosome partitioning protein